MTKLKKKKTGSLPLTFVHGTWISIFVIYSSSGATANCWKFGNYRVIYRSSWDIVWISLELKTSSFTLTVDWMTENEWPLTRWPKMNRNHLIPKGHYCTNFGIYQSTRSNYRYIEQTLLGLQTKVRRYHIFSKTVHIKRKYTERCQ